MVTRDLTLDDTPSNTSGVEAPAISASSARPTTRAGRKAGQRPRLLRLTPELRKLIMEMILDGVPIGTAAVAAGIPKRTFFDWLSKGRGDGAREPYRSFTVEVDEAQEVWAARAVQRIDAAGDKDYRALTWMLERKHPDEWGDHSKAGINVQVNVQASPEWRELLSRVTAVLRDKHPDALRTLAAEFGYQVEEPLQLEAA